MILKCLDGPMDGAVYVLSRNTEQAEERSTNRKPDGMWFDAKDEFGRNVQHQYAYDRLADEGSHVTICYRYTGQVVDTGIEMETTTRREAADKQSYDDLAASGGIVDAP